MFEKAWYELSPYIYVVAALLVMYHSDMPGTIFAFVLLCLSGLILFMRYQSRTLIRKVAKQPKSKPKK